MANVIEIARDPGQSDVRQCLYAAAFLMPGVTDVSYRDGTWRFEVDRPTNEATLASRLDATLARFAKPAQPVQSVFSLEPPAGARLPGLDAIGQPGQALAPGLFIYDAAFARLLRFLDDAVLRRFAPVFAPREEAYPNVIPIESLWKANHLSSFPEHLHFVSHLETDIEVLDRFAEGARRQPLSAVGSSETTFAPSRLTHNPSTCYHCYARRAGQDIGDDQAVTAVTKCHRFESLNHREPGRLMEFTMRELIFLGAPDFARETRTRSLELVEVLVRDWDIYGSLVTANDPFFSSDFANKAAQQLRLAMKYEYKALLPPYGTISVLSSNLHGPTFSKAFSITQNGRPINTGCIGFGYERLALVILAQHGAEPSKWPAKLVAEYAAWCAHDPLGA